MTGISAKDVCVRAFFVGVGLLLEFAAERFQFGFESGVVFGVGIRCQSGFERGVFGEVQSCAGELFHVADGFGEAGFEGFADADEVLAGGGSGVEFGAETFDEGFEFGFSLQCLAGAVFVVVEECSASVAAPFFNLSLAVIDFEFEALMVSGAAPDISLAGGESFLHFAEDFFEHLTGVGSITEEVGEAAGDDISESAEVRHDQDQSAK
jgi:hypothetical protein